MTPSRTTPQTSPSGYAVVRRVSLPPPARLTCGRALTRRPPAREQRKRPLVTFTLSKEAVAAVDVLAVELGLSKSATVELAIRRLMTREGLSREELEERVRELEKEQKRWRKVSAGRKSTR